MALTKSDLQQTIIAQNRCFDQKLATLQKNILLEIGKFLEEHVLEPIFELKKDVSVLKKDVREIKHTVEQTDRRIDAVLERGDRHADQLKNHEKRITKLEQPPVFPQA